MVDNQVKKDIEELPELQMWLIWLLLKHLKDMSDNEYDVEGWGSGGDDGAQQDDRNPQEIEIENSYYEGDGMWK